MSVAIHLLPYPRRRDRDREAQRPAELTDALRQAAADYERYTVELAKACELLRKYEKLMAGRPLTLKRVAHTVRRIARNKDEEMDQLARFIMDKGCYPGDSAP